MNRKAIMLVFALMLSLGFAPVLTSPAVPNPYHLISDSIGEPETVDPAWAYDTASQELIFNVYETLIFFDGPATDKFFGGLAETGPWTIADGLRLTFKLREGVKFHNGKTLTTEDVEYSFERWMVQDRFGGPTWMILEPLFGVYSLSELGDLTEPADVGMVGQMIDNAVESNATHVWFNLVMPYAPFLSIIAQSWASILSEQWCTDHGDFPGFDDTGYLDWINYHDPEVSPLDWPENVMCGTGPYKFDYWDKGVEWSIVKFDDYWGGWPAKGCRGYVTRVTEKFITEWATRKMMFLAGDADIIDVPRQYINEVFGQPGIRCTYPLPTLSVDAMFFNFETSATSPYIGSGTLDGYGIPPDFFNDINVRKAFAYSFDYDKFILDAYLGEGVRPATPVIWGLPYYNPQESRYDLNLAEAGRYFRQAWGGQLWNTGFIMSIVYNTGNVVRRMAWEMIKAAVESLNPKFHIDVMAIDWSTYLRQLSDRELPLFTLDWIADYPDPHNFVCPFMHTNGDFAGFQGYGDQFIDITIATGIKAPPDILWFDIYEFDGWYDKNNNSKQDPGEGGPFDPSKPECSVWLLSDTDVYSHIQLWKDRNSDGYLSKCDYIVRELLVAGKWDYPSTYHIAEDLSQESAITIEMEISRQMIYYLLQEIYVEEVPSVPLYQPTGRHWERTWVQGWYYNPIAPTNYYHLWKEELLPGDINSDGKVDIKDMFWIAKAFGSEYKPGAPHPRWNSRADVNQDQKVDIKDCFYIAKKFGCTAPPWTPP